MAEIPKILLLIDGSRADSNLYIRGITHYAQLHGPWVFYKKPPYYVKSRYGRNTKLMLQEGDFDGIIAEEIIANIPSSTFLLYFLMNGSG